MASLSGDTALKLHAKAGASVEIIAVTYCAGSWYKAEVEQFNNNRDALVEKGIALHACVKHTGEKNVSFYFRENAFDLYLMRNLDFCYSLKIFL